MTDQKEQAGDRLLWLAAGVVALMGVAWLVVAAPWSQPEPVALAPAPETAIEIAAAPAAAGQGASSVASARAVADPLQTARMALEAGMLTEPAEYSAWTLYGRIVAGEPDNAEARAGLEQVAAALLQRGTTALEQGRFADAEAIVATVTGRFPEHDGARALAAEIVIATTPPEPPARPAEAAEPELVAEVPEPVDPIPAMNDAFRAAMARNDVLRPAGTSAVDIVGEMLAAAPEHTLSIAARDMLVTEMLDRSAQSIEARDTRAAQTWIDSAAPLADPALIARAQDRLTQYLIEIETARLVPASELRTVRAAPPEFPSAALDRGIEGWVEIEFVVAPDGETENVTVTDASHDRYFREEAVTAVEAWRFEPVVFMDRAISKRASTRLEFVID